MSAQPSPGDGPLVVVCLRITDQRPEVDPLTGDVARDVWGVGLSPADAAALEYGLRVVEAWSGRLLAVSAGPSTIEPVLREVLALGVAVLRVPTAEWGTPPDLAEELAGDERGLARALVGALAPSGPVSLVLCGDHSVDRGTGALPSYLAHELGAAQALGLVSLDIEHPESPVLTAAPPPAATLIGERRLDGGWRERLRIPLPAVCSVEGAGVRLRRASLIGALEGEAGTVALAPPVPAADGGGFRVGATRPFVPRARVVPGPSGDDPRLRLLELTGALEDHDPPTIIGPVGAAEAADALIEFLQRHEYLDPPSSAGPGAAGRGS